ncbi:hypothetical protein PHMEG_00018455 [Phytophthora megakarya]|uniref:Reverse transcriptase n=1 Tax=Phytophthora megakarya TaxID=4795 RepID=A0A225VVK4_9STRA|nr:hypothetical protein PHMEG_00018455 [Phytophthora megakarya]
MQSAEEDVERNKAGVTEGSTRTRSKFEADRESASNPDPVSELVNSSVGDMFSNGEPDESIDILSHEVVPEGLRADAKKIKRVTGFSFSTSKKGMQSFFGGALNYYSRFIQDFAVYAAALYQLKDEDFEPGGDLSVARQSFAKLQ